MHTKWDMPWVSLRLSCSDTRHLQIWSRGERRMRVCDNTPRSASCQHSLDGHSWDKLILNINTLMLFQSTFLCLHTIVAMFWHSGVVKLTGRLQFFPRRVNEHVSRLGSQRRRSGATDIVTGTHVRRLKQNALNTSLRASHLRREGTGKGRQRARTR